MTTRTAESLEREFDEYMKCLAESIGCDMEVFMLASAHGNDRLRWAALIQERLEELGALAHQARTMPRPSTGYPPAEYRCGICGGLVHFDGTAPTRGCWGHRS